MIELLTNFSKLRMESAKISYGGAIDITFLEYIDKKDGSIHGLRQIDLTVGYKDVAAFDNDLLKPYLQAAQALWQLRDGLVAKHLAQ